jgi:GT2 family glycosyltransferase
MEIEAVVVTHNSAKHIVSCLDSLLAEGTIPIVVDNESNDSTLNVIKEQYPQVNVIPAGGNLGYGRSVNRGFRETAGQFVLLSNSDVIYCARSVQRLVEFLRNTPDVGLVGGQQLFPDGSWQRSYADLPGLWTGFKAAFGITTFQHAGRAWLWPFKVDRRPKDVPYVAGAVLLVRREAFEAVGGFDETFFRYGDESDLCVRTQKAGWRTVFYPGAQIIHVGGGDSTQVMPLELYQNMVDADIRVARKYLSLRQAKVYVWLRYVEYRRLTLMYKLASLFGPRRMKPEMKNRSVSTGRLAHLWRDKRRQVLRTSYEK